MTNQFSELSLNLTKNLLSLDEKKNNGIYFTPLNIIKLLHQPKRKMGQDYYKNIIICYSSLLLM
jgi:hypothetical protein